MDRPDHLPDFVKPPLNEVVLGVQFDEIQGYQQIYAGEIWALFSESFSKVQDHPSLQPVFETFGPKQPQKLDLPLSFGPTHDRFWFLKPDEEELIQFQHDRLLHNWRNVAEGKGKYPHFEPIAASFETELNSLDDYFSRRFRENLKVNQCEISYVNHVSVSDSVALSNPQDTLRFLKFEAIEEVDDFSVNFRRVLRDENGEPNGRLIVDVKTAMMGRNEPIIILNLTVRGAPVESSIDAAMKFLKVGRELIVETFASITTDAAHALWERSK